MPWSTRAIILIAFAIQMVPVSEQLAHAAPRPVDRLILSDGRLMALWVGDASVEKAAGAAVPLELVRAVEPARESGPGRVELAGEGRDRSDPCLLPIPPPALA